MNFSTNIKFSNDLIKNNICTITYSGYLFENNSDSVHIVYGFGNNWNHTSEQEMEKTEEGFTVDVNILDFDTFNFCFRNSIYEWDNNNNQNYTSPISEEQPEELNFILNDETVIEKILNNLFEIDLSNYKEPTTTKVIETVTTVETPVIETATPVEVSETIENAPFEIEVIENVPVSIEESLVNSTESASLDQDIEKIFNDIYTEESTTDTSFFAEPIEVSVQDISFDEITEDSVQTINVEEPTEVIEEQVQTIPVKEPAENLSVEEISKIVVENLVSENVVEDTIVEEINNEVSESAEPTEVSAVPEFNMNNLIDEILSPIVKSSVFDEEPTNLENYTPEENTSTNFFDDFEDLDEDLNLDNKIDTLIADLFNNTKEFAAKKAEETQKTTVITETELDKAIDNRIEELLSEPTVEETTPIVEENITTEEVSEEPVQTIEMEEKRTSEEILETPAETQTVKPTKIPDFTVVEDDDDEESLIESRNHTIENTALIEVPDGRTFVVSPRSLGKFYMFKKKVKLAFTKLFVGIPRLLKKGFNTENN